MKTFMGLLIIAMGLTACSGGSDEDGSKDQTEGPDAELIATQDRLINTWDLAPYDETKDNFQRSESFDSYFVPVGVLTLSSSELIGRISDFEIGPGGSIYVMDRDAKTVIMPTVVSIASSILMNVIRVMDLLREAFRSEMMAAF